jgi:uroporphyrin-III C-methyltransferase
MTDSPLPPHDWPDLAPGEVWLVGAGPGDPGLLTLAALNALRQADVVVTDALVARAILAFAPQADVIAMGKRGGRASPRQAEITARLIALSREGRRVVRLKGGDPFTFGRGAEEALELTRAGVVVRVVPGLSSGPAGLAVAGIPLTHAGVATVSFVTGHDASGSAPETDWAALARGSGAIVLYMAMRNLGEIAQKLIAAGRAPNEPVAIVQNATTPAEKVLETTLAACADDAEKSGIGSPSVVCVGADMSLRAARAAAP